MKTERTATLKIGELARISGVTNKSIRYYEERGLLEPAARTESGYRLYGAEEAARLEFIQRAKLLGLSLEKVRELVVLAARRNGGEIVPRLEEILEARLGEAEQEMRELTAFRENLLYYRERVSGRASAEFSSGEETSFCDCMEAGGEDREGDREDRQRTLRLR